MTDAHPEDGSRETDTGDLKRTWVYDLVLGLLVVIVFTPVIYTQVLLRPHSDFPSHIYWAEQMMTSFKPDVPLDVIAHAGWQVLVIIIRALAGTSFPISALLATLTGIVLMALVLFHWMKPALRRQGISLWWGVGIALGLNLVTPIFLVYIFDRVLYFGYLGMTTYHNPTIILLRPFAILQLIFAVRGLEERDSRRNQVLLAAVISVLATFIKPVFAICLLPALGLIMLYRLVKKQPINWKMLGLGLILPTVVMLGW